MVQCRGPGLEFKAAFLIQSGNMPELSSAAWLRQQGHLPLVAIVSCSVPSTENVGKTGQKPAEHQVKMSSASSADTHGNCTPIMCCSLSPVLWKWRHHGGLGDDILVYIRAFYSLVWAGHILGMDAKIHQSVEDLAQTV